jgi:hypothetical protein
MKRYLIKEILLADTYERIALVKRLSDDKEIFVYFLSHDDFVTDIKEIKSIKKGDILEGRLLIDFVCKSMKINNKKNEQSSHSFYFKSLVNKSNKISYEQPIKNSSYIEAIVEVYRVIDEYSIYVKSDISDRKILIDFESRVSYNKGDMIYVEGELKIDDFKVIKNSKKV